MLLPRNVGLSEQEFEAIVKELGRQPNELELRLFGVMWSEHCSYKSTRPLLSLFPVKGKAVFQGPGENAGVVKINDEWGLAFKVESHNHPSAIDPYQGAATGVGGIIRDIIAMGARPIASMDGLFFGEKNHPRTKELDSGIIKGIADYGNTIEVPTVGGKTAYDACYTENPLVNAFSAGLLRLDKIAKSSTARPGSLVMLLGARTGRDGVAGAAFASTELATEASDSQPKMHSSNPEMEKRIIDCCLELLDKNLLEAIQDMGAAGIVSSTSEIAAKSKIGICLELDKVLLREPDMEPWEICLSETQERMAFIVAKNKEKAVLDIAAKYKLDCEVFGSTNDDGRYTIKWKGKLAADLPPEALGGNAPIIHHPASEPGDMQARKQLELSEIPEPDNWDDALLLLLSEPNLHSKRWIWKHYDSIAQGNTITGPGSPVSVVRLKEAKSLAAFTMEAEPWKSYTEPYSGATETIAQSVRTLALAGAEALAFTNCLNFPSPEKPEQFFELQEVVKGLAEAAKALDCPVVSGNVSLYNETKDTRILPTAVIVTVGLIPSENEYLSSGAMKEGDCLYLVGKPSASLGASRWAIMQLKKIKGATLPFDSRAEKDFVKRALATARKRLAGSGRTIAGGGLLVAIAKECIAANCGADIDFCGFDDIRPDLLFFSEGGARAIYAVPKEKEQAFLKEWKGFPCVAIGKAKGPELAVKTKKVKINTKITDLQTAMED